MAKGSTIFGPSQKADMHAIGAATSQESIAYREKLDNVSATAATADNVLGVVTDPKKMLGLLMLIGLVVLIVYLLRNQLSGAFAWVGGIFDSAKAKRRAKTAAAAAGEAPSDYSRLSDADAKRLADQIEGAFGWIDDDEEAIYSAAGQIYGTYNWQLVKDAYGTRHFTRWMQGRNYDLEGSIAAFLSNAEKQIVRNKLRSNGVSTDLNF